MHRATRAALVWSLPAMLLLAGCVEAVDDARPGQRADDSARGSSVDATSPAAMSPTGTSQDDRCSRRPADMFPKRFATQDGCRCPWKDGCGTPPASPNVTLDLAPSVAAGGRVNITATNVGATNLTYTRSQCAVEAWTQAGRQLWTMCGTDGIQVVTLRPGGSTQEPFWRAVECLEAESTGYTLGCTSERPLAPGTYSLRWFLCGHGGCTQQHGGADVTVT